MENLNFEIEKIKYEIFQKEIKISGCGQYHTLIFLPIDVYLIINNQLYIGVILLNNGAFLHLEWNHGNWMIIAFQEAQLIPYSTYRIVNHNNYVNL